MSAKRIPLGVQTFQDIIDEDLVYVDKTRYIYTLTHTERKYVCLTRPRHFGKSLLISTLATYFMGKKDYFKGLAIEELESEWISYPTLIIDLSKICYQHVEEIRLSLSLLLDTLYKEHGLTPPDMPPGFALGAKLDNLITELYEKYAQRVVVLVDEYDTPILTVAHKEDTLKAAQQVMREFFAPLKSLEYCLRFVFLAGITKEYQAPIFDVLNNLQSINMSPETASICGFTKDEIQANFSDYIDELATALNVSPDAALSKIESTYNGYHFCWPSADIYNPISVLSCFRKQSLKNWRYLAGSSASIVKMLKASSIDITHLGASLIEAQESDFDRPTEKQIQPVAFLYQAGYLTIKDKAPADDIYIVGIPNQEVYTSLFLQLLAYYTGCDSHINFLFTIAFCQFA